MYFCCYWKQTKSWRKRKKTLRLIVSSKYKVNGAYRLTVLWRCVRVMCVSICLFKKKGGGGGWEGPTHRCHTEILKQVPFISGGCVTSHDGVSKRVSHPESWVTDNHIGGVSAHFDIFRVATAARSKLLLLDLLLAFFSSGGVYVVRLGQESMTTTFATLEKTGKKSENG